MSYLFHVFILLLSIIFALILYVINDKDGYKYQQAFNRYYERYLPIEDGFEFDKTDYPWRQELRLNYKQIRNEFDQFSSSYVLPRMDVVDPTQLQIDSWHNQIPWEVLFLHQDHVHSDAYDLFPKTRKLLSNLKGCYVTCALISVLPPGKRLPAHVGVYRGVWRYHLALKTPSDPKKCFLKINKKKYIWKEGEDVIFDDTYSHEVMNLSKNESRVVLFLDIQRDFHSILPNIANSILLAFGRFSKATAEIIQRQNTLLEQLKRPADEQQMEK